MFISEQGKDLFFLLFFKISTEKSQNHKWLDFYPFLNTLKNNFLPDINWQIIEQGREETKTYSENKFSVRAHAFCF